jgi:hypothetical protein
MNGVRLALEDCDLNLSKRYEAQAQLCAEIVPTADTPNFSTLPYMQGTIHT